MICLGANVFLEEVHDQFAAHSKATSSLRASMAGTPLRPIGGCRGILEGNGHGVGGELTACGAWPGTGMVFQVFQFGIGHLAGRVFADRLEHILNGDVMSGKCPGMMELP